VFVLFTNQKPVVKWNRSVHLAHTSRRVLNQ